MSAAENDVFVGAAAEALDASTAATAKPEQRIATLRMAAPFTPVVPLHRSSFPPGHKGVKAIPSLAAGRARAFASENQKGPVSGASSSGRTWASN